MISNANKCRRRKDETSCVTGGIALNYPIIPANQQTPSDHPDSRLLSAWGVNLLRGGVEAQVRH